MPRNTYVGADGHWVVVSGTTDAQVARLLRVLDLDTPENRSRFGASEARVRQADELVRLVAEWIAARSRDEGVRVLVGARIAVAPVPRLSAPPGRVTRTGPELGASNEEVYGALLGLTADQLAGLRAQGVV